MRQTPTKACRTEHKVEQPQPAESSPRLAYPRIAPILVLAAVYSVTGHLGLLLAIPPGYATAVWPPSGIALAGVLVCGSRVWPGIVLGSFLVNIWTSFDATNVALILKSVALAASIGTGAALQALAGAFLVRRYVDFPSPLVREKEIGAFLGLGGPLSCLVSATVGVATLLLGGVVPWAMAWNNWWTWWVGDTIGVLVITPLLLTWTAEPRQVWRRRRLSVAVPLAVMFVFIVVFFAYTNARERHRLRLTFERRASTLALTLDNSLDKYLDQLHALQGFYASSVGVDRQEFHTFVAHALLRHPGIQALSWSPRVPDSQRAAYEVAARRDGYPDFRITEQHAPGQMVRAALRTEYVMVYYVEPYEGNESALGFDVASHPTRLEALQRARDSGAPTATARITLVQETGQQFGFLVFLPIYRNGLPHNTVEERRQALQGYATGVFRIGDMVQASLTGFDREGIALWIFDASAPEGERLLYSAQGEAQADADSMADTAAPAQSLTGLYWHTTMELAGRQWTLHFSPTPAYLAAQQPWQPWAVQVGGCLFTGLLGAFLLVTTGRTAHVEQLVAEQTAELLRSNQELEQFAYVASHDLKAPLRGVAQLATWIEEDLTGVMAGDTYHKMALLRSRVRRLEGLLEDLLQYARVGRNAAVVEAVDTRALVTDIVALLAPPAGFVVTIADTLPTFDTAKEPLRQVFMNLIGNAIKHHDRPDGRVTIAVQDQGEGYEFLVADDGPGIPPAFHQKIFQLFQTLKPRDEVEGSGIGLTIAKKVVEAQGGTICVESEAERRGTTMQFTWRK